MTAFFSLSFLYPLPLTLDPYFQVKPSSAVRLTTKHEKSMKVGGGFIPPHNLSGYKPPTYHLET